jgi:colanic acid biosynthesis glycosyl transferase WcaI
MAARRLIFVNRYFHPDQSATSQILSDLCFALARSGHSVTVVASRQLYENPNAALPRRETVNGVEIRRIATTGFGRSGIAGRLLDYLSFHVGAWFELLRIASQESVVVALTDPPMLSVTAGSAIRLKGARLINWLQDLYPEVASRAQIGNGAGLMSVLRRARNRSLHTAAMNVAIGETMARRIAGEDIPTARITTISNWSDDAAVQPRSGPNPLREEWDLNGKIVVGHSGNLGTAHDADTVIDAAEELRARADIVFLVIGGGSRLAALKQDVAERGLTSFVFKPYQPRERLPLSLSLPDIHWLSLRSEFESLIVPSKFYGIAAAGRPMILIGEKTGELGNIIVEAKCGAVVAPKEHLRLAEAIVSFADNPELRAALGSNARQTLESRYSMQASIAKWEALLASL